MVNIVNPQQNTRYTDLFEDCVFALDMKGDALDFIGQNTTTVSGATLTTDRFGISDNAYYFDGSNDKITMDDSIIPMGTKSISFWLSPDSLTDLNIIMTTTNLGGSGGTAVFVSNVTTNKLDIFEADGSIASRIQSSTSIPVDSWSHWVYTWDGTTAADAVKIYYNGSIDNTETATSTQVGSASYTLAIGGGNITAYPWDGIIDKPKIWSRALSSDEIKELYQLELTKDIYPFMKEVTE